MTPTRSWTATVTAAAPARSSSQLRGWLCLTAASLLVAFGLVRVYRARTENFPALEQRLAHGELLNLNRAASPADAAPFLITISEPAERDAAAAQLDAFLQQHRPLTRVGALAALRGSGRTPLLPLQRLKPLMVVRTPAEFRTTFRNWIAAYFAAFYLVALLWRVARFPGDRALLAALHLLTGFGLILMISLRDPLRDSLEFRKFALGVAIGCLLLLLPLFRFFDYRKLSGWCYTPLFGALALFGLLLRFGSGPGGAADIKVNLGPFQPVELIKIAVVLFLAGYFSQRWESLRDLRQKRFLPKFLHTLSPRWRDVLPVGCAVGLALALFFVLKDLGPALVTLLVFLTVFVVARGRPGLAVIALVLMISAVTAGYRAGTPHTVVDRIDMWLSPWDNDVHGGNQLAHSLWALSTGGPLGSGPGWGDPAMIPAGNTDLVLPAIGEEWGFAGVAAIILLFAFVVRRGCRIAARAATHYGVFLALGLTVLIASEMLLITAGVLGVLPLSGVVSPFLSSGNTAMLANFLVVALLLSVAARPGAEPQDLLGRPLRHLEWVLGVAALVLLGAAARYQVLGDRDYLAREARTYEEDGVKRAQRNPRLNSIAHEIPRGSVLDRNGLPVATSDWDELERHRAEYAALGIDIDRTCSHLDTRHYPFGAAATQVVGDLRTGENFHATNASLVEHDSNRKLQGYDFAELVPLMRSRHQPGNPGLARILARDRNVRLTLDMRLQLRATDILRRRLAATATPKGAAVVMEPVTGDVLALVSLPAPDPPGVRSAPPPADALLDRARYGQYPPGSTFKLVTAIAALRADPALKARHYTCRGFAGGRAGVVIPGWNRPIYDDIGDHAHGTISMETAITVSCNAWFAQLGVHDTGSRALADTAALLGFPSGDFAELKRALPFAAYGQGPMLATPFKMARVSALIAAGGRMPQGRWTRDDSNTRSDAPLAVLPPAEAEFLAGAMRKVVTQGTARRAMAGEATEVAGKTGTAQVDVGAPHAWFTGFAPYDADAARRIAFAVVVEHGGYGGRTAAPVAREIVDAARDLGLIP